MIVIFFSVLAIASFFAQFDIDSHHDGIMFKTAVDISQGKILFRDTYTHYGPIPSFIQGISVYLFGQYVLVIRLTTAILYAITGLFLWLIWEKYLSVKLTVVSLILWVFLAPYYYSILFPWASVYGMLFTTIALFIFLDKFQFIKDRKIFKSSFDIFVLGIVACLAFLSKQPYLLLFLALNTFFIILYFFKILNKKVALQSIRTLTAGFLTTYSTFFIWLIANNATWDYWLQNIREGYIEGRIIGNSFLITAGYYFYTHPLYLLINLCVLLFFIKSFISLKNNKDINSIKNFGVSIICISSLIQIYPTVDDSHEYWAITPAIGLFVYFLNKAYNQTDVFRKFNYIKQRQKLLQILSLFFLLVTVCSIIIVSLSGISDAINKVKKNNVYMTYPYVLKGMHVSSKEALYYADVSKTMNDYLKKHPNKHFVIDTSDPLYLTFTDSSINVLPLYVNYSGATSGLYPFDQKLSQYIYAYKPLVMVQNEDIHKFKGYTSIARWNTYDTALIASLE